MRRNGTTTATRRTSTVTPSGPIDDRQRTTLSFLLATIAIATSAFLGLGQAAASASAADSIPVNDRSSSMRRHRRGPAQTNMTIGSSSLDATEVLVVTLERLQRVSDPTEGTPADVGPSTSTTTAVEATPASSVRAAESTTVVTSDTMAIRPWRPVPHAAFRRFVEARDFTTVDYVTPALVHGTIAEGDQHVNVVLVHRSATSPMRVSPVDRSPEPVGQWARAIGATAAINANWYNPFDGPAVSAGRVYGGADHGYTALFGFTADGDLVADHHHKIHDHVDPRVVEAVSGHPTLVHRGTPTTDFGADPTFSERHPRTAIGVSASVDVLILVTVDGRRADAAGMTGAETTTLLQRLGAHDAVMLDGGGSSGMWIAGKGIVNRQSDSGRAVGNQVAVFGR